MKEIGKKTGIGEIRLVANKDNLMGPEGHYWHVLVRNGGQLEDVVLTSQQYDESRVRAERSNQILPKLSILDWIRFRFSMALVVLLAAMLGIVAFGTGCATPTSTISSDPVTGQITMKLPKDASWDLLTYERSNNWVRLVISNASFKMNPEVINAAAKREADMIRLGMELGKKAAAAAAGVP